MTVAKLSIMANRIDMTKDCWIWQGSLDEDGYGRFPIKGQYKRVQRLMYELVGGKLQKELTIDHLCRVRNCVNPNHLEQVSVKVNTLRGNAPSAINYRKTHCKYGHPFDEANTYYWRGKMRKCIKCNRRVVREWHRKRASGIK